MGAIPGMIQDLLCISKLDTSRHFLKRWTEWCYFLNETRKFRLCDVLKRSIRVIRNLTRAVWDLKRRVEYYIKRSAECADKRYRAKSGMILDTRCIIVSTNECRETILFFKTKNCSSQLDTSRKIIRVVWDIKGRTDMQYYYFSPSFARNLEIRYDSLKRSTECFVLYIYFVLY